METKQSKKNKYSAGEIIAGIIGIVFFGIIGCYIVIIVGFCILTSGAGSTIAVYETSISPTGLYQAEAVRTMGGGAAGYDESDFRVEVAEDGFEFSREGDEPSNYINIAGLGTGSAFTQYDIQWISDDTFTVIYGTRYGQVTMNGKEYNIRNGEFEIDRKKSYMISYEESDEEIYYNCLLAIRNPLDRRILFHIECAPSGWSQRNVLKARLYTEDEKGEPQSFSLEPNSEGMFNVSLKGLKSYWESEEKEVPENVLIFAH